MARPLIVLLPALTAAQDMHAAFMSQHGVQHKLPLISDDLIVGLIMIMFLMLFAFGMPSARVIDHIFGSPLSAPTNIIQQLVSLPVLRVVRRQAMKGAGGVRMSCQRNHNAVSEKQFYPTHGTTATCDTHCSLCLSETPISVASRRSTVYRHRTADAFLYSQTKKNRIRLCRVC